jgi:hypothetical protein
MSLKYVSVGCSMRASTRRGQGPKALRDVAAGIRLDRDMPHMLRLIDRARTWFVGVDLVMRGTDEIVSARLRPRRRAMLPGGMPPEVSRTRQHKTGLRGCAGQGLVEGASRHSRAADPSHGRARPAAAGPSGRSSPAPPPRHVPQPTKLACCLHAIMPSSRHRSSGMHDPGRGRAGPPFMKVPPPPTSMASPRASPHHNRRPPMRLPFLGRARIVARPVLPGTPPQT